MQEFLTWGALITAGGAIVAVAKFWMDRGKAEAKADGAHSIASAALVKAELATSQLNEHKVEAAREFATVKDLATAESRFASAIDGIRSDIRDFAGRLDKLLVELIHKRDGD